MYDDILLPVAPGSAANDAVPHARSLAEQYDATVHVVSAVDTPEYALSGAQVASLASRVEDGAERRVETVTSDLESSGVDVVGSVLHGEPLRVIEDAIDDAGVDLVVIPAHTRTGLQRVLLGSVTENLVRISPVPVVTVPMVDGEE